ncbi:MAG: helix-turn-helix domain-containing protein [Methylophilus sp.]
MIYIQIKELIQTNKAQFGRKITLNEVSTATGISRMTLFRMMKNNGYNTLTDHLDKLCTFFECEIHELVKFVPDSQLNSQNIAA